MGVTPRNFHSNVSKAFTFYEPIISIGQIQIPKVIAVSSV